MKKLESFVARNNIICEQQLGFLSNKSTGDAILKLTTKMYEAIDNSRPAICVFTGLAKASDTMDHTQLLDSLQDIRIREIVHFIFGAKLAMHKNFKKIVQYRVTQGNISFIIYFNYLFKPKNLGENMLCR